MSLFAVALKRSNQEVADRIEEHYPNPRHYRLTDTFFLLESDELTRDIATKIGVRDEPRASRGNGAVFKITTHAGYTDEALWEWIGSREANS